WVDETDVLLPVLRISSADIPLDFLLRIHSVGIELDLLVLSRKCAIEARENARANATQDDSTWLHAHRIDDRGCHHRHPRCDRHPSVSGLRHTLALVGQL